jgi:hypothetical protein
MTHARRLLIRTAALLATGAAIAVSPALADSANTDAGPAGNGILAGNPVGALPLSQLAITRDRPIFSPSRRPPPPPPAAAPIVAAAPAPRALKAEPERPPMKLVGTIASETDAIAVFIERTTGTVIRLHTREGHAGWILTSVQGREATLEKGRDAATLVLEPPGGGGPELATASADPPPKRPARR